VDVKTVLGERTYWGFVSLGDGWLHLIRDATQAWEHGHDLSEDDAVAESWPLACVRQVSWNDPADLGWRTPSTARTGRRRTRH
jgi:hypothetical protein